MSGATYESKSYAACAADGGCPLHLLRLRGSLIGGPPVLLLHGSTLPGSIAYTIPFGELSWLDDLAARGFDAWTLDFRGYGQSWKPQVGAERPCPPVADTAQAVQDLACAIAFIRAETGADDVDLVGWSWGATTAATYIASGGTCRRLVLHAPQWLRDTPSAMVTAETMSEPYRTVDAAVFIDRWLGRIAPEDRPRLEAWRITLERALAAQALIAVPNGSARDIATQWMAGKPGYDPGAIHVPTLVIVGSADTDTPPALAREVFERIGSAEKQFVELAEGTHFAVFEPARTELFRTIAAFLEADTPKSQEKNR